MIDNARGIQVKLRKRMACQGFVPRADDGDSVTKSRECQWQGAGDICQTTGFRKRMDFARDEDDVHDRCRILDLLPLTPNRLERYTM